MSVRLLYSLLIITLLTIKGYTQSTNLIINPSAEDTITNGWIVKNGTWKRVPYVLNKYPVPSTGNYTFFANIKPTGWKKGDTLEMYQIVDLRKDLLPATIKQASYEFSAYNKAFTNAQYNDTSQIIVELLDENNKVLQQLISPRSAFSLDWAKIAQPFSYVENLAKVKVRLLAFYYHGTDIDCYFDDIILRAFNYSVSQNEIEFFNFISPNNDAENEAFVIKTFTDDPIKLTLINKWGNIIFETDNYKQDFSGANFPDGNYIYKVSYLGKDYSGKLMIKRD